MQYSLTPIGLLISFKEYSAAKSFSFAQEQANRWVVAVCFQNAAYRGKVKIYLLCVRWLEILCFQLNYRITDLLLI